MLLGVKKLRYMWQPPEVVASQYCPWSEKLRLLRKSAALVQRCQQEHPKAELRVAFFFSGYFFLTWSTRHGTRPGRERERERDLQGGLQMMSQVAGLGPQVGGGETGAEEGERHKIKNLALGCCGLSGSLHDKL